MYQGLHINYVGLHIGKRACSTGERNALYSTCFESVGFLILLIISNNKSTSMTQTSPNSSKKKRPSPPLENKQTLAVNSPVCKSSSIFASWGT